MALLVCYSSGLGRFGFDWGTDIVPHHVSKVTLRRIQTTLDSIPHCRDRDSAQIVPLRTLQSPPSLGLHLQDGSSLPDYIPQHCPTLLLLAWFLSCDENFTVLDRCSTSTDRSNELSIRWSLTSSHFHLGPLDDSDLARLDLDPTFIKRWQKRPYKREDADKNGKIDWETIQTNKDFASSICSTIIQVSNHPLRAFDASGLVQLPPTRLLSSPAPSGQPLKRVNYGDRGEPPACPISSRKNIAQAALPASSVTELISIESSPDVEEPPISSRAMPVSRPASRSAASLNPY